MPKYQVQLELNGKPHSILLEADTQPDEASILGALKNTPYDANFKPPSAEDFAPKPEGSSIGRALQGAWDEVNPVPGLRAVWNNIQGDLVSQGKEVVNHPFRSAAGAVVNQVVKPMARASWDELRQVPDAVRRGSLPDTISHTLGAVPLIGPAGVAAREEAGKGNIAGAVGHALGAPLAILGGEAAPRLATRAATTLQRGARSAAEMHLTALIKPKAALVRNNPGMSVAGQVLDHDLLQRQAKYSPFGSIRKSVEAGEDAVESLGNKISAEVQGNPLRVKPTEMLDQLDALETSYLHSPNGAGDLAAVRNARQELLHHPLYSQPVMGQVNGQWVEVGRTLRRLPASEIDLMKKNVYAGLKGKYGVEKGAVIETDKSLGRGLKQSLERVDGMHNPTNPQVRALNQQQGGAIVGRNALADFAQREGNKFKQGLMDFGAIGSAAAAGATGLPFAAPLGAAYGAYSLLLKHPTTAIPVIQGMNKFARSTTLPTAANAAGRVAQVGTGVNLTQRRVTKDEAMRAFDAYLASQQQ